MTDKTFLEAPVLCLSAPEGNPGEDAPGDGGRRRFHVLAYTGSPVDTLMGRMVIDVAGMSAEERFPILREHARDRIVGVAESWLITERGFELTGMFSGETDDAREVQALAAEGYPWQASIGVWAKAVENVAPGTKAECNGIEYEGPLEIWRQSAVREVSFVTLGADPNTSAEALSQPAAGAPEDVSSGASLAGDAAEPSTPEKELAMADEIEPAVVEQEQEAELSAPAIDCAAIKEEAALAERRRAADIDKLCGRFGFASLAAELKEGGFSMEQAREKVLEKLSAENPRAAVECGADARDRFLSAAADGIMLRLDPRYGNGRTLAEGADEMRHMGLQGIARECLAQAGQADARRLSNTQVADRLLSRRARLSQETASVTSDFTGIFKDVLNKRLLQSYENEARTWEPLVTISSADDFKDRYGIELSGGPDLEAVTEGEAYTTGVLKDGAEKYGIVKYGKVIQLTWEMLVNDDLGAFGRLPQIFGSMAARKVNDVVWGIITSNPTLSDSKAVFHANHKNLISTGSALSADSLDAAYQLMMDQKGLNGERTPMQPRFLCVAPSQRTTALVLLDTPLLYADSTSGAAVNVWKNSGIVPIVEPRLTKSGSDTQAWYLFADPNMAQTIDVAFLDGRQAPEVLEHDDFTVDAISYKVRLAMGAGWMNFRGACKNPGV